MLRLETEKEKIARIGARPTRRRVRLDDAREPEAADYLVKGVLPSGSIAMLYGASGEGKTFVALDMALRIARGMPWHGRRVHRGFVVYIAAEAGRSIETRIRAWLDHYADASEGLSDGVAYLDGANLLDLDEVSELFADLRLEATPIKLVVVDTLSRSTPGGAESAEEMSMAIAVADQIRSEFGASVLFVHHSGKDESRGARGHSSLPAGCDTVLSVADRVLTVTKQRDGAAGETFGFDLLVVDRGLDKDGDMRRTCVAIETEGTKRAKRKPRGLPASAKTLDLALTQLLGDSGEFLPATSVIPGGVKAVRIEALRQRFAIAYGELSDGSTPAARRQSWKRALDALFKAELVRVADPWIWKA